MCDAASPFRQIEYTNIQQRNRYAGAHTSRIQRKKRKTATAKEKVLEQEITVVQPALLDPPKKNLLAKSDDMNFGDFEL